MRLVIKDTETETVQRVVEAVDIVFSAAITGEHKDDKWLVPVRLADDTNHRLLGVDVTRHCVYLDGKEIFPCSGHSACSMSAETLSGFIRDNYPQGVF